MPSLSGVVIVTGAASGIGRCRAAHFCACGATVLAADLNGDGLATLAGERLHTIRADLTRSDDCKRVADRAASLGRIAGLLNCAGLELHGSVVDMAKDDWDRVLAVNLKAIFPAVKARHPAHGRGWWRRGGERVVSAGIGHAGGRRGLRRRQGRSAIADPRDGARPRQAERSGHRGLPGHD